MQSGIRSSALVSAGIAIAVALVWILTFVLNTLLDPVFLQQMGVSWVFLPAGIRLLAVAVFRWDGAIGLVLGSLVTAYLFYDDTVFILGAALISGAAPLLALLILESSPRFRADLARITPLCVLVMCLLFATINSALSQSFFLTIGVTAKEQFLHATFAMFVGDLVGSLIIISLVSVTLRLARNHFAAQGVEARRS